MKNEELEKYAYHFEVVQLALKTAKITQEMYDFQIIEKTAQDIADEVNKIEVVDEKMQDVKATLLEDISDLIKNVLDAMNKISNK